MFRESSHAPDRIHRQWLDARLQVGATIRETAEHPVPRETASWFYVFGSAAFVVFMLQIVTGIMLALIYVPSAGEAWNSLQTLNHNVALGWYIRALHGWGSDFMVAIVLIHMVQVFLFGAYKFPRELTWIVGVFLLLVTLGMAFTGQVLQIRPGRLLGLGNRRLDRQPRAADGPCGRSLAAGRPDHRRRHPFSLFRSPRLRRPRASHCLCGRPSADGR